MLHHDLTKLTLEPAGEESGFAFYLANEKGFARSLSALSPSETVQFTNREEAEAYAHRYGYVLRGNEVASRTRFAADLLGQAWQNWQATGFAGRGETHKLQAEAFEYLRSAYGDPLFGQERWYRDQTGLTGLRFPWDLPEEYPLAGQVYNLPKEERRTKLDQFPFLDSGWEIGFSTSLDNDQYFQGCSREYEAEEGTFLLVVPAYAGQTYANLCDELIENYGEAADGAPDIPEDILRQAIQQELVYRWEESKNRLCHDLGDEENESAEMYHYWVCSWEGKRDLSSLLLKGSKETSCTGGHGSNCDDYFGTDWTLGNLCSELGVSSELQIERSSPPSPPVAYFYLEPEDQAIGFCEAEFEEDEDPEYFATMENGEKVCGAPLNYCCMVRLPENLEADLTDAVLECLRGNR